MDPTRWKERTDPYMSSDLRMRIIACSEVRAHTQKAEARSRREGSVGKVLAAQTRGPEFSSRDPELGRLTQADPWGSPTKSSQINEQ